MLTATRIRICRLFFTIVIMPVHMNGFLLGTPCKFRLSSSRNDVKSVIEQLNEKRGRASQQSDFDDDHQEEFVACLEGYVADNQRKELEQVLLSAGYANVLPDVELKEENQSTSPTTVYRYRYMKAVDMLKLIEGPNNSSVEAPRYIPIQRGMENVLVANGWSFLDPDESEPLSAFDVDAANKEGQYTPKWGVSKSGDDSPLDLSSLGYNLQSVSYDDIVTASQGAGVTSQAKKVLLEGGTDPSYIKQTNNGYDFSSAALQAKNSIPDGIFACAIGSLPLFSTDDMPPSILSASSGWLSFSRPLAEDHIKLIHPNKLDLDQRIEVVDARTECHLGHYFGQSDGYCINASALNFVPLEKASGKEGTRHTDDNISPYSWRLLLGDENDSTTESTPLRETLRQAILSRADKKEIIFGAGCFWHVEFALRRLPGVIDTEAGYAGGTLQNPTYKDICTGTTGHAEVVKVSFDPTVCDPRKLIDCWLAMHDPTVVRAHGKRARKTGQYRSCVYAFSEEIQTIGSDAVEACQHQLGKELSSEVRLLATGGFCAAEECHQRHDERRRGNDLNTLTFKEWLAKYGRRTESVFGSSETIQVLPSDDDLDDGMARMMI